MLYIVEVPTGLGWTFSPEGDDQTVTAVLEDVLGESYTTFGLTSGADAPALAVSYIGATRVSGVLCEWRNHAAETLALAVCEPSSVPRTVGEFYGTAIFHVQTSTGPDWLTQTAAAGLAETAEQITAGLGVLDAPKP